MLKNNMLEACSYNNVYIWLFRTEFWKTTNKEIENFEKKLWSKLPMCYRDFLLKYNWGFIWKKSTFLINKKGFCLEDLFWVNPDWSIKNILWEDVVFSDGYDIVENAFNIKRLTSNWILIIWTVNWSSAICISLNKKDFWKIYYWDCYEELDDSVYKEFREFDVTYEMLSGDEEFYHKYFTWSLKKIKNPKTWKEEIDFWEFNEYYNITKIADSFEEFIEWLITREEYEEKYVKPEDRTDPWK